MLNSLLTVMEIALGEIVLIIGCLLKLCLINRLVAIRIVMQAKNIIILYTNAILLLSFNFFILILFLDHTLYLYMLQL